MAYPTGTGVCINTPPCKMHTAHAWRISQGGVSQTPVADAPPPLPLFFYFVAAVRAAIICLVSGAFTCCAQALLSNRCMYVLS